MRTCLVVDPSNVVRKVACRIFESMQYVTGEAETAPQAMEKCMAQMPDAILLDGHMPDVVATEFLASLRALPNGSKPTILYCTTEYCTTENDSSELARAVGRRRRLHPEAVRSRKHPPEADLGRPQVPATSLHDAPLSLSCGPRLMRAGAGGRAARVTPARIRAKPTM